MSDLTHSIGHYPAGTPHAALTQGAHGERFNDLAAAIGLAPLRHALRALASEPDCVRAPHGAIARLRPQVEAMRDQLTRGRKIGGTRDERRRNWTRLADGAVIGLSHLVRVCIDTGARSPVAPFALLAVGEYGARRCDPDSGLDLQFLLPRDPESWERGGRIVTFIRDGLAELGLEHQAAVGTADECAAVARVVATTAARFVTARFLSGQYGLHAGFAEMMRRSFDVLKPVTEARLPARKWQSRERALRATPR